MQRYKISMGQNNTYWTIYDRKLWDECGLPDETGKTVPLRWSFKGDVHGRESEAALRGATAWLRHCYRTWEAAPTIDSHHPADIV